MSEGKFIDIVFDGPPGPVCGRFVEVEDQDGKSINAGEWIQRDDGYWVLRFKDRTENAEADTALLDSLDVLAARYGHSWMLDSRGLPLLKRWSQTPPFKTIRAALASDGGDDDAS